LLICRLERLLISGRKPEITPLFTPMRRGAVDLEPLSQRDPRPRIAIGRVQPGTTKIERLAADADGVRPPADPPARRAAAMPAAPPPMTTNLLLIRPV
jgi:hypothetical protein